MSILNVFRLRRENNTAKIAKERLQIIVAHERAHNRRKSNNVNLQELQSKLIDVIAEYLHIDRQEVNVELERNQDRSILELNVTLPDTVEN